MLTADRCRQLSGLYRANAATFRAAAAEWGVPAKRREWLEGLAAMHHDVADCARIVECLIEGGVDVADGEALLRVATPPALAVVRG